MDNLRFCVRHSFGFSSGRRLLATRTASGGGGLLGFALGVGLLSLVGCDIPRRPPVDSSAGPLAVPAPGDQSRRTDSTEVDQAFDDRWETWEVYYVEDRPVGLSHVTAQPVDDDRTNRSVQYVVNDRILLSRGSAQITQVLKQTSTETPNGQLVDFHSEWQRGPLVTRFTGSVNNSKLVVETRRGQRRATHRIPWESKRRGLIAVEQTLRRHPMRPGDSRILKTLMPITHQLATVRLDCVGEASVPLIDGQHHPMLEVVKRVLIDDRMASQSVMWIDRDGHTKRTYTSSLNLLTYRTDEATAEAASREVPHRESTAWVNVTGELHDPAQTQRVAYRVSSSTSSSDREDSPVIEPAPGQYVRAQNDGWFDVLVSRRDERVAKRFAAIEQGTDQGDLDATAVLDFRSRSVREISQAAIASDDLSDRELALEMTRTVHALMTWLTAADSESPDAAGVRPASEVARRTRGDSADHAVLLTALLRGRGIPSRLALGLRYLSGDPTAMGYHVWTIAHVDGRWVPLDATLGSIPPADRLTLATTNLSDSDFHGAVQTVLGMLGRLKVRIQGAQ